MTTPTVSITREFIVDALRKKTGPNKDRVGLDELFKMVRSMYSEITPSVYNAAITAMLAAGSIELMDRHKNTRGKYIRFAEFTTTDGGIYADKTGVYRMTTTASPPDAPASGETTDGAQTPQQERERECTPTATQPEPAPESTSESPLPPKETTEEHDDDPKPRFDQVKALLNVEVRTIKSYNRQWRKYGKKLADVVRTAMAEADAMKAERDRLTEQVTKQCELIENALVILEKVPGVGTNGLIETARYVATKAVGSTITTQPETNLIDGKDIHAWHREATRLKAIADQLKRGIDNPTVWEEKPAS